MEGAVDGQLGDAEECPVNAVYQQDELPAEWAEFAERNAAYFREKDEG